MERVAGRLMLGLMNTAQQAVETARALAKKKQVLEAARGCWTKSELSLRAVSL